MDTVDVLCSALRALEGPASGPEPKDIFLAQYWGMAGAHALLLNGLLSVYQQAPFIPEEKVVAFVGYALQWTAAIDHHHGWEENLYYPLFGFELDSAVIVNEHAAFMEGIEALERYLISCLPDFQKYGYGRISPCHKPKKFNGAQVQKMVDESVHPLAGHFLEEIKHLHPTKLHKAGLTKEVMKRIASVSNKHMRNMPATTFLVYSVIHAPSTTGFPPVPNFVKSILVPYVLSLPHRKYWQFAPAYNTQRLTCSSVKPIM